MTPIPGGVNDPLRHTLQYRDTVTFQLGVLKKNKRLHSNVQHASPPRPPPPPPPPQSFVIFIVFHSAEVGAAVAYMAPRPYAH